MSEIESADEFFGNLQYIRTVGPDEHSISLLSRTAIRRRDAAVRADERRKVLEAGAEKTDE